jgi:hypothetical protein
LEKIGRLDRLTVDDLESDPDQTHRDEHRDEPTDQAHQTGEKTTSQEPEDEVDGQDGQRRSNQRTDVLLEFLPPVAECLADRKPLGFGNGHGASWSVVESSSDTTRR